MKNLKGEGLLSAGGGKLSCMQWLRRAENSIASRRVKLKESYVIFICTQDLFGKGLSVYTFRNVCSEDDGIFLDDKSYKVFYNVDAYGKENEPELSALLEYLCERRVTSGFTCIKNKTMAKE